MNQKLFHLILLLFLCMRTASAVTVDDLYTVELPVADQTTSLRLDAFTEAFKQVVVKVSGSDDALHNPALKRPIERSSRYVKQFSYVTRQSQDEQELSSALLYMRVDFNQQLVENLLRDNNYPIWGRERPGSLLVVSYDENENIKMVASDTTPEVVDLLDVAASRQGLPLLLPLMDLEDISLVHVGDVISRHFEKIEVMASRYSPDVLVVGQIFGRSDAGWQGDWEVRFLDQVFKWQYQGSSKDVIIDQLINHLAKVLALEYALEDHKSPNQNLFLSVSAMTGIENLIAVQQYLQSLNVVDSVRVSRVEQDVVTYLVRLRNGVEDLQRLIEFGNLLEQENFPQLNAQNQDSITLNYAYINRGSVN
ncbi:MAG: DUF2066 domain-containing protein [Gammaproteobacteria bacterium]|nr:DUF2066 domain-containing protein [Gammaproteobacteria bacterium]